MQPFDQIRRQLADVGLNVWGVADGRPYANWMPGCASVVVVGNGGRHLWEGFELAMRQRPDRLRERSHPFDAYVAEHLARSGAQDGVNRRWVRCASDAPTPLDFRTLARQAGLGHPSRLGLLLHPTFGPWFGLRAACFTTEVLTPSVPPVGESPCEGCPAPCVTSCPGRAFAPDLRIDRCVAQRAADPVCAVHCASRAACPSGRSHAYGDRQHRYHSAPQATRRRWLAEIETPKTG